MKKNRLKTNPIWQPCVTDGWKNKKKTETKRNSQIRIFFVRLLSGTHTHTYTQTRENKSLYSNVARATEQKEQSERKRVKTETSRVKILPKFRDVRNKKKY